MGAAFCLVCPTDALLRRPPARFTFRGGFEAVASSAVACYLIFGHYIALCTPRICRIDAALDRVSCPHRFLVWACL